MLKGLKLANAANIHLCLSPNGQKLLSYIFINVRDSSAISRTTLLQIHSKREKDLQGSLFRAARPNPESLVLPAASARFSRTVHVTY